MLDIVIKNGTVIDGTGSAAKKLDVGIQKGLIVEIDPNIKSRALQTIDAKDRYVVPGFIDIQNHSDSYWTIFDQPDQTSLISQGITSIVMGNCGSSLAPLLNSESIKSMQKWHNLTGINLNWASMAELLKMFSVTPLGVNVATLVGHATVRRGILGDKVRKLNNDEIKVMNKSVQDALEQGAMGLSLGLVYAHEVNSSTEELKTVVKSLKPQNKYLSVHLRSEGRHVLESLDEVIELANSVDVPVKISHIKVRGTDNWHLFDRLMSKLEIAYHQGTQISYDVYPYDTSWSVLYTYLPKWSYEGGKDQILKMISDPLSRRKILDFLRDQNQDYKKVIIAEAHLNPSLVGKTLGQIAQNQGVSVEDAVLNVISATNAQVIVFDQNLSNEQVEILCTSPLSMIATDGAGFNVKIAGLVHPRCFGTVPRFLKMVRDGKTLKWELAIKKLTSEPAALLGLKDRGIIAKNKAADIAVFDPRTITDRSDFVNSFLLSEGIDTVLVNGKVGFTQKKIVNMNGTVLKR